MLDDVAGTDFVAVDLGHFVAFPEEFGAWRARFGASMTTKRREARDGGKRSATAGATRSPHRSRFARSSACLISSSVRPSQEILHLGIDQPGAAGEEVPGCGGDRCRARCRCRACRAWRPGSARRHCRRRAARCSQPKPALRSRSPPRALDQPGAEIELRGVEILPGGEQPASAAPRRRRASCRRRRWHRSATSHIARRQGRRRRRADSRRRPCPCRSRRRSRSTSICAKLNCGKQVAGLGRRLHQRIGALLVLLDETPVEQQQRILELRLGNALLGGQLIPFGGLCLVARHAEAARQDLGDQRLRGRIAVLGARQARLRRSCRARAGTRR